jgi:hypothetical protein
MTQRTVSTFRAAAKYARRIGRDLARGVAPSRFHVSTISLGLRLGYLRGRGFTQATEAPEAAARPLVECRDFGSMNSPGGLYDAPHLGGARNAVRMRCAILQTADPHRMKIAEQDRESLAAAELPLLVSDAWWLPLPQMGGRIKDYQTLIQPPRRGNVALSI